MFHSCTVTTDSLKRFEGTGRLVWNDSVVPKLRGRIEEIGLDSEGQMTVSVNGAQFNYGTSQDQDWRDVTTANFQGPKWRFEVKDGRATITISASPTNPRWFDADFRKVVVGDLGSEQLLYFKSGSQLEKLERMPTG